RVQYLAHAPEHLVEQLIEREVTQHHVGDALDAAYRLGGTLHLATRELRVGTCSLCDAEQFFLRVARHLGAVTGTMQRLAQHGDEDVYEGEQREVVPSGHAVPPRRAERR